MHLEPVHVRAPTAAPDPDGPGHLEPGLLVARLVLARGVALVLSAPHCCKELRRCTAGRSRLAAGCRAVIRRPTFAVFSLLLADKGQRNAQSTSLAFSLLLTTGSAQTNKHPPSPSTTAKSAQATFSALSRGPDECSLGQSRMMHGVQKVNIDLRLRQKHAPIFTCTAKLKSLAITNSHLQHSADTLRRSYPYCTDAQETQKLCTCGRERAFPTDVGLIFGVTGQLRAQLTTQQSECARLRLEQTKLAMLSLLKSKATQWILLRLPWWLNHLEPKGYAEALVLKKHPRILMERCLDFGARVRNKTLFIAKYESPTFKVTTPLPHVLHN